MKRFFLLFLGVTLFNLFAVAQKEDYKEPKLPVSDETKLITYTKVVDVTANKDSLYKKGKKWFYTFYKNPTGVIKEDDAANGKITGKHQIKILNPADKKGIQTMKGIVKYTVTANFKDNKARIVISDINIDAPSYTPVEKWQDKTAKEFSTKNYYNLTQMDSLLQGTVNNFEKFMKESNNVKKDEW